MICRVCGKETIERGPQTTGLYHLQVCDDQFCRDYDRALYHYSEEQGVKSVFDVLVAKIKEQDKRIEDLSQRLAQHYHAEGNQ